MNISQAALASIALSALLYACSSAMPDAARQPGATSVERMYVIECGENHAKDLSIWTSPADKGKAYVFANHCYLIRHRAEWFLWDSGHPDMITSMPNGVTNPRGTLTVYMKKPLAESLKEIGVTPADIAHFAMSHSHGDHSGNARLFARSTIYMQAAEYEATYGPDPLKLGIPPANFESLREARIIKLNGDHDVFRDGSVVIKSTPGHTPGHQSLFVRLPKTGPVLLSGDFVHLTSNWQAKRVPSINYNAEQTIRSMNGMESFLQATGAILWINHDAEQSRAIPKAPAFVE
ncbi:N-acyl homoserine lactonase family protein [Variovorax paradoxus]|nr:N-acyl homoserine lactonase family protein [Variovorax paradoxus]